MPLENISVLLAIHSDWALLALRFVLGAILVTHGYPKITNLKRTIEWFGSIGFHPGWLWGTVAAVVEFVGGAAIVGGVLVRLAALAILGQFIVIIIWRLMQRHEFKAFETDLMLFAGAGILVAFGGGAFILLQLFGF